VTQKEKQAKVRFVINEFKAGKLKSSSGEKITSPQQALAIALSSAGMSRQPKKDMGDEYYMAFMKELEGKEEEENDDTMDESTGEKRCKAYLATVRKNKGKKT
jgi:hypothetical protein